MAIVTSHNRGIVEVAPSASAIYRCLRRHGLVQARKRRRQREDYKRWQRERPMELWQLDVIGGIALEGGRYLKVVTGVDDHSRFCVLATVVVSETARAVAGAFAGALRRYGVPDEVLTDNGSVSPGGAGSGLVRCREPAYKLTSVAGPLSQIECFRCRPMVMVGLIVVFALFARHSWPPSMILS